MCDKAVNTYHSIIQFGPDCYVTQKICDETVNRCFLVFTYIPDWYKTQEMCDSIYFYGSIFPWQIEN